MIAILAAFETASGLGFANPWIFLLRERELVATSFLPLT